MQKVERVDREKVGRKQSPIGFVTIAWNQDIKEIIFFNIFFLSAGPQAVH